jgi:hypothetical protein
MDSIIEIFKNLADASCNQLTELYAEQIESLEQIVEATSQQYRAGTSHALTTPSSKKENRKILLTPAKKDNSENKEKDAPDSFGITQQLEKAGETSGQDSNSTHVTPLHSRASSLSGRRRRRRRDTAQEQVKQQTESDSTKSTSQIAEEPKAIPVQETVILQKADTEEKLAINTQESIDQKVNGKPAESDDEQDVVPPKKAANNKSKAKTRVISRKGQTNTRRTRRNRNKAEEEINTEETPSDEKNLEDMNKEENNQQTIEAPEIASEKMDVEKKDIGKDRISCSNSKEAHKIYADEIGLNDSKEKKSLTTAKEEKASPQIKEVSDVEKMVIYIDEEHVDSSEKATVQQSVESPAQMHEELLQDDPIQMDNVIKGQTEEDSPKLLLDAQPVVNDEKDYMDEEDFGDTIVLSVPQRTDMMQRYESPVQIIKKEHRQSLLFYPIDIPIIQSKRDEDKDNQAFKLFDLEKRILALKGNHKTPDKSLLPGQHPPSFLSPSVRKIVEQNSRSFSGSPHVSKFFEDEEPLSPETPETKARSSPPKLHIVPTKFVSISPHPTGAQVGGNGKKSEMSTNISTNEKEPWRNDSHVPELSPIKIDTQPELVTNFKTNDKPETGITNLSINTSKSSKTSLTKRKLEDSSYSASNKRIKVSGESVSSSRLSVSSVTSVSSYASVGALSAASSIGGNPSNLNEHNLSSQQDNKGGWFQNIIGGVNSFLSLNKSKKPEEKKKHPPIKSLQQAEIAKKKEDQKKLDKDQKAADLKKKKLRENLEAQKKKKAEEARNIKDDKNKKTAYQPKETKPGILTQSSSSNTVSSKGTALKSSGTLLSKVIKPSAFKKPDVTKLKLKQSLDKQALDKLSSVSKTSEENYRLSTNSYCSEDEEQERKRRQNKKIPAWATGTQLRELILRTSQLDPDLIFAPVKTCDLDEIFGTVVGSRERKRTSSRNWSNDEFTLEEELAYKKSMGFV